MKIKNKRNGRPNTWQYRIIKCNNGYTIGTVYYDEQGYIEGYNAVASLYGDTLPELIKDFANMKLAFEHNVLEISLPDCGRHSEIYEIEENPLKYKSNKLKKIKRIKTRSCAHGVYSKYKYR